jgi:3'-phosphoadenosine 5'-phosphosulfate (PAPS) 3'-phosphatase
MVDGAYARWLASRTGQLLIETRADLGYDDPAALQSAGRKLALDVLLTELARLRPADAVLAEGLGTGGSWSRPGGVDRGPMRIAVGRGQLVGQYDWDLAGPVAVAAAAGLYASRVDGSPLRCNQADPRTPDLLVCRKDLAAGLVAALRRAGGE